MVRRHKGVPLAHEGGYLCHHGGTLRRNRGSYHPTVPAGPRFAFVQFEFTHAIGPHAGSYVVVNEAHADEHGAALRSDDLPTRETLVGVTMKPGTADVLAITVLSAAPVRKGLRRRARDERSSEVEGSEVPLLLATFVRATEPFDDEAAAARMLDAVAASEDRQDELVRESLEVLNRAVRAYRAGARDPYVTEVGRRDARRVRVGYGTSDDVTAGAWDRAIVLPPPAGASAQREERLAPTQTTADVLSGRTTLLEAEDVLLRAYIDLDHDRLRAAAVQVRGAVELLRVELGAGDGAATAELDALAERGVAADSVDELESRVGDVADVIERRRAPMRFAT
jgi:hypothetical protein